MGCLNCLVWLGFQSSFSTVNLSSHIAIVTHKGASADGGHYIGWVRKASIDPSGAQDEAAPEGDKEEWFKFDDDKVSVVTREKIATLDGGGEDSTAYILLYRYGERIPFEAFFTHQYISFLFQSKVPLLDVVSSGK